MVHYDPFFQNAITFKRKEIFPIRKNQKCAEFNVEYKCTVQKKSYFKTKKSYLRSIPCNDGGHYYPAYP